MRQSTIKKFRGLQLLQNSFNTEGYLEIAENVVIIQDDILQSRRGHKFTHRIHIPSGFRFISNFKDKIIGLAGNNVYYLQEFTGNASVVAGSNVVTVTLTGTNPLTVGQYISEISVTDKYFAAAFLNGFKDFGGIRAIATVSGLNITFFADTNAIHSVSNVTFKFECFVIINNEFSFSPIDSFFMRASKNFYFTSNSGVMKLDALNEVTKFSGVQPSYDLVGSLKDTTPNKGLGFMKPNSQVSYRVTFSRLDANDNLVEGSPSPTVTFINKKLVSSSVSGTPTSLNISTAPIQHGLVTGDIIYIVEATGSPQMVGLSYALTSHTLTSFTINISPITSVPTSVVFGTRKNAELIVSLPAFITTAHKMNVYRTEHSSSQDVTPFPNFRLVDEVDITAAEVTAGKKVYVDDLYEEALLSSSELYTNPTAQGPLQLNDVPPYCVDLATWKNISFYANTTSKDYFDFNVVSPVLIAHNTTMTIGTVNVIFKKTGLGNEVHTHPGTFSLGSVTVNVGSAHGFAVNDVIFIYYTTGFTGSITLSPATITSVTATTFTFSTTLITGGSGDIKYQGRNNSASFFFCKVVDPSNNVSIAEAIDQTARNLANAINWNTASGFRAIYVFDPNGAPGRIRLESTSFNTLPPTYLTTTANGEAFFPTIPASSSEDARLKSYKQPAGLYWSKLNQPEAVPPINFAIVGEADKAILRLAPLRDSLLVIKEDGVFRVNGDTPDSLSIIPLDTTVRCKSSRSVQILNNSVYMLSNQGFVQVLDTAIRIVSRDIEPVVIATFGKNLEAICSSISSESDRSYICSMILPNTNATIPNVSRVYNYLTNTWTDFTNDIYYFKFGTIDSSDRIRIVPHKDSKTYLTTERKNNNRTDFIEESEFVFARHGVWGEITATAGSVDVEIQYPFEHNYKVGDYITLSNLSFAITSAFPSPGDILYIRQITAVNGNILTVQATNAALTNGVGIGVVSKSIREVPCSVTFTLSSQTITVTTPTPHNLSVNDVINIDVVNSSVSAAFSGSSNVTGSRIVQSVTPTTFTFDASTTANVTGSGELWISSKIKERYVAINSLTKPRPGDCLFNGNYINQILEIKDSSVTDFYTLRMVYEHEKDWVSGIELGLYIRNRMKFSPITSDNVGLLKQAPEFQCSFRNSIACSRMLVSFSNDSKANSSVVDWDALEEDFSIVSFGGWGQLSWGDFPWGAGVSIDKVFVTQPAVILRTYVPMETVVGTFIQVGLDHRRAGESLDLQSISILNKTESNRTTK